MRIPGLSRVVDFLTGGNSTQSGGAPGRESAIERQVSSRELTQYAELIRVSFDESRESNPLELVGQMLRYCRAHEKAYYSAMDSFEYVRMWFELKRDVDNLFRGRERELPAISGYFREVRQRIRELLAERYHAAPPVIKAHAVAAALDKVYGGTSAYGNMFYDMFIARSDVQNRRVSLKSGDVVPVARPRLVDAYENCKLSTGCGRLPRRPDVLTYVRLAPPEVELFRVDVETRLDHAINGLFKRPMRIGVGMLNGARTELDYVRKRSFRGDVPVFRLEHDRPPDQFDRMARVLDMAKDQKVTVLLFPELCISESDARRLLALFRTDPSYEEAPQLVVAGSGHVQKEGIWRNSSVATLRRARRTLEHHKFSRFLWEFKDSDDRGRDSRARSARDPKDRDLFDGYFEEISCQPRTITIYLGKEASVAILICLDFLDPVPRRLLDDLGVSLILVPSYSPKGYPFAALSASLTHSSQATIVIANHLVDEADVHAIFATPQRSGFVEAWLCPSPPLPALAVFDLSSAKPNWYPKG
jgi:predicted amidohydrolase